VRVRSQNRTRAQGGGGLKATTPLKFFEKGHPSPFKIWAAHFLNILGENDKQNFEDF